MLGDLDDVDDDAEDATKDKAEAAEDAAKDKAEAAENAAEDSDEDDGSTSAAGTAGGDVMGAAHAEPDTTSGIVVTTVTRNATQGAAHDDTDAQDEGDTRVGEDD